MARRVHGSSAWDGEWITESDGAIGCERYQSATRQGRAEVAFIHDRHSSRSLKAVLENQTADYSQNTEFRVSIHEMFLGHCR